MFSKGHDERGLYPCRGLEAGSPPPRRGLGAPGHTPSVKYKLKNKQGDADTMVGVEQAGLRIRVPPSNSNLLLTFLCSLGLG